MSIFVDEKLSTEWLMTENQTKSCNNQAINKTVEFLLFLGHCNKQGKVYNQYIMLSQPQVAYDPVRDDREITH